MKRPLRSGGCSTVPWPRDKRTGGSPVSDESLRVHLARLECFLDDAFFLVGLERRVGDLGEEKAHEGIKIPSGTPLDSGPFDQSG